MGAQQAGAFASGSRMKDVVEIAPVKPLMQGSFGTVKMAGLKRGGHTVAVKCVPKSDVSLAQVQKEVRIMQLCKHSDHCLQLEVNNLVESSYECGIVLEFSPHGDLLKEARRCHNEDRAAYVMKKLLEAVEFLHSRRICHRDIKLENVYIMLERGPQDTGEVEKVKLGNFAWSTEVEPGRMLKEKCGSDASPYMTPEMKMLPDGQGYNQAIDVWAVGVIMVFLLCGEYVPDDDSKEFKPKRTLAQAKLFYQTLQRWKNGDRCGVYKRIHGQHKRPSAKARGLVQKMLDPSCVNRVTASKALNETWFWVPSMRKPSLPDKQRKAVGRTEIESTYSI